MTSPSSYLCSPSPPAPSTSRQRGRQINPHRLFPELQLHSTGNRNLPWSRMSRGGCAVTLQGAHTAAFLAETVERRRRRRRRLSGNRQEHRQALPRSSSLEAARRGGEGRGGILRRAAQRSPYLSDHFLFLHKPNRGRGGRDGKKHPSARGGCERSAWRARPDFERRACKRRRGFPLPCAIPAFLLSCSFLSSLFLSGSPSPALSRCSALPPISQPDGGWKSHPRRPQVINQSLGPPPPPPPPPRLGGRASAEPDRGASGILLASSSWAGLGIRERAYSVDGARGRENLDLVQGPGNARPFPVSLCNKRLHSASAFWAHGTLNSFPHTKSIPAMSPLGPLCSLAFTLDSFLGTS